MAAAGGPYNGIEGIPIVFNGSGSFDADGNGLTYSWDFGDGTLGTGVSPSHTYAVLGTVATYTATLVVNDGTVDSPVSTATVNIEVAPPGGGSDVTLGNVVVNGATLDIWNSNMLVNESDTYTNISGSAKQVSIERFGFYARRVADPVTPFVVRVNGNDSFTVLAIGTTRTGYNVGVNDVVFSDTGPMILTLNPGEKLATGFLDANADGSGGGIGSVIPWDNGGDELWYTGGSSGSASGSVAVGLPPIPGSSLLTNLNRIYHYSVSLTINGGSGGAINNGSFELDSISGDSLVTNTLTDWAVTTGNVELLSSNVYSPPAGNQSLDLNGNQLGNIQQVVTGLTPNSLYTLYISYADQSIRGSVPELVTADIYVNAVKVGDIRTTANAPETS